MTRSFSRGLLRQDAHRLAAILGGEVRNWRGSGDCPTAKPAGHVVQTGLRAGRETVRTPVPADAPTPAQDVTDESQSLLQIVSQAGRVPNTPFKCVPIDAVAA